MSTLSHSELLKSKIRLVEPRLREQETAFWHHPRFREALREHMFHLYHAVRASVPLMVAARAQAHELADRCPVAARLVPYLGNHIREERGHDEWLLEDAQSLGLSPDALTEQIAPPDVAALIGTQYYYIKHGHPVAIVGYLAVVEGSPPDREVLDRALQAHGIPGRALRSFYKHAEIDMHHSQDLWRLLDSLPLTPRHTELLGMNVMLVSDGIACMMESVLQAVPNDRS